MNESYFFEGREITKTYGPVIANYRISFGIKRKEIVGLVGDNAAGKSTLIKQIMGVEQPDEGDFYMDGKCVKITSPMVAKKLGINAVYQELAIFPHLSVVENIFAGELIANRFQILDWKAMKAKVADLLNRLRIEIPLNTLVRNLSGGKRQEVAIARALLHDVRLLLMDEPTAALSVKEREKIFQLILDLKTIHGISIILVGHNIEEVFQVVDRFIVLSRGRKIADIEKSQTSVKEIVAIIVHGGQNELSAI